MDNKDKSKYNILIVKPSSLGDIIHTIPAVNLIIEYYSDAEIDWIINPEFQDMLTYIPNLDRKIIFQRKDLGNVIKCIPTALNLIKEIRQKKYDFVFDFQGLMRSAIFARLASSNTFIGFDAPKEFLASWLYNMRYRSEKKIQHALEKNISLVTYFFDKDFKMPQNILPKNIEVNDNIIERLKNKKIESNDKLIGIIPGARWESKKWPTEFFIDIINKLSKENSGYKFVILGAKSELNIAEKILTTVENRNNIASFVGETNLIELTELIRITSLILTNDSGPMHIAAALKVKSFVLFGPTDADKTGPYGNSNNIYYPETLDCIKCFKRKCPKETTECHNDINKEKIIKDIIKELSNE